MRTALVLEPILSRRRFFRPGLSTRLAWAHAQDSLDAGSGLRDVTGMSTAAIRTSKRSSRKPRAQAKGRAVNKGPSFGEWARRVAGMIKGAPSDLSTREGFGE